MKCRSFAETTFAVVDVETTGFDPRVDRVVEVACVLMRDGRRIDTFDTLIDPERPIPAIASAVHHLTDAHVRGAPTLERVAQRLREMTMGTVVVAHNASFDLRFLPFLDDLPALCSMRFARTLVPDAPNFKNQVLRYHLGIDDAELGGVPAHRALGDALVTSRIFATCVVRHLAGGGPDDVLDVVAATKRARIMPSFPFGRYRGEAIVSIPSGYLEWLRRNVDDSSPDVRMTVDAELLRRGRSDDRPRNEPDRTTSTEHVAGIDRSPDASLAAPQGLARP